MSTYSIAIRTLGTGGAKYQNLLNSIKSQTVQPQNLFIIIAHGYDLPPERLGIEKYVYTQKGMWHQRVVSLEYASNFGGSDYILTLDDDVAFEPDFVEKCLSYMDSTSCDVLIPSTKSLKRSSMFSLRNIYSALSGIRIENPFQKEAVAILSTAGFMVNNRILTGAQPTQSGPFYAFIMRADKVSALDLNSEYWLDKTRYSLPDDQVFFYKCHLMGLRQYRHSQITVEHLDHGSSDSNRSLDYAYACGKNFLVFWHRFLYKRASFFRRIWLEICFGYRVLIQLFTFLLIGLRKCDFAQFKKYYAGLADAVKYLRSKEYQNLPVLHKIVRV